MLHTHGHEAKESTDSYSLYIYLYVRISLSLSLSLTHTHNKFVVNKDNDYMHTYPNAYLSIYRKTTQRCLIW